MKIADWHRIMQPGAIILGECDPRLVQRVGPANARIDPKPDFIMNSEHAIFMHCLKHGIKPPGMMNTELGDIMRMPLGNHPERGLTCSRP